MPEKPPYPKDGDMRCKPCFAWWFEVVENKRILWESYWEVMEFITPPRSSGPQWQPRPDRLKENKPKAKKKTSNNWMDD